MKIVAKITQEYDNNPDYFVIRFFHDFQYPLNLFLAIQLFKTFNFAVKDIHYFEWADPKQIR